MQNFKAYSSKSNAKRAAIKVGLTEEALVQVDGKWGFYEMVEQATEEPVTTTETEVQAEEQAEKPRSAGSVFDLYKPAAAKKEEEKEEEETEEAAEVAVDTSSPFGGMAAALLASRATAANNEEAPRKSVRTCAVEKDRPEQNGIKRPSAGGACRAVWDKCDKLREENGGEIPTAKQVRAVAESMGWNMNNAMIEFYQWRKYNGITGRAKKSA